MVTSPTLGSFFDELYSIQLEKEAGLQNIVNGAGKWAKGQYSQLNTAAAQALSGGASHNPITGQQSIPLMGTISNFVGNKLPAPSKPAGPLLSKAKKLLSSKPAQAAIPVLDQASEFLKLAQVSPYQQKTQYSCSAACLKAVLEHWGADRFAEHEIMHAIGVRDKGGAEVDQITEGAKKLGFEAYDKCFTSMEEAKKITDQDIPIIADFQSFNNPGKGHYVVITKIDDNIVHLMDPNTDGNERVITRAECEKRWWDRTMAPPHSLKPKWGVVVTKAVEKTASSVPRWAALGGVLGGLGGAYGGYKHNLNDPNEAFAAPAPGRERILSTLRGGAAGLINGAVVGGYLGSVVNNVRGIGSDYRAHQNRGAWGRSTNYGGYGAYGAGGQRAYSQPRPQDVKTPLPFKGVKSKAEAKQRYRDLAMKHHPDVGGSKEKFQELHNDWQNYQKHPRFPKNS